MAALVLGTAGPVSAQDSGDGAFESLASCFSERERLLVLAVMDESGSLRRTDPEDRRVLALQSALTNFAGLRQLAGDGAKIEVGLAGFGADFHLVHDWTDLGPDTVSRLRTQAQVFADRDNGVDTDFATALDGAQSALAQRSADLTAAGGEQPCSVLLLFTDGAYDIEPRSSAVTKWYAPDLPLNEPGNDMLVEEAGQARICEDGGLADTLRETGVPLITIAFTSEIAAEDQTFLRAMSSGEASGTRCGEIQRADAGAYLPAADLSDLLFAFDRATGRILTGQPLEGDEDVPVCAEMACPEGTREFELDASLRQAHILAHLVAPGVEILLQGPDGEEPVRIEANQAGSFEHSGAQLTLTPLSQTDVVIDAELPPEDDRWVGAWSVTFVDTTGQNPGAIARTQIILFGALQPEVVGEPTFRLGEPSRASVQVIDQEGTPRTPRDFVAEARMTGVVTNPIDGAQQQIAVEGPDADGIWTAEYTPPEELDATAVNLSVTLDVRTVSGVNLQPRTTTISVPVLPPATYPSISPEQLHLGTLVGAGELTETITITGAEENGGCVWFSAGAVEKPRYAGDVTLTVQPDATSEGNCLRVEPGETQQVQLTYAADEVANGAVRAPLTVNLRSDASPDVIDRRIPASFDMLRPVNQARRIGYFFGILLPGLLLPFVLMYLVNWVGARYRSPGSTRHARIRTRITADGALERANQRGVWSPFDLGPRDFSPTQAPTSDVRSFASGDLELDSYTPWNPFRESYGTASKRGTAAVASDGRATSDGEHRGRLGFELPSSWVFVIEEVTDPSVEGDSEAEFDVIGELHAWLDEAPFAGQGPQLASRLAADVPAVVHRAASELYQAGTDPADVPPGMGDADGDVRDYRPPGSRSPGRDYRPPRSGSPGRDYGPPGGGSYPPTGGGSAPRPGPGGGHSGGADGHNDDLAADGHPSEYRPPSTNPDPLDHDGDDGSQSPWTPPSQ